MAGLIRYRTRWPATLDKALESNGLIDVSVDRLRYEKAYLSYELETGLLTWEEMTQMVIDPIGEEYGKKARELIVKAYEEGRAGGAYDTDRITVVGRKPS